MRRLFNICLLLAAIVLLLTNNGLPCYYVCGDANSDEVINIGDVVFLINHIFRSGISPEFLQAADANNDGSITVADAVFLINYVFRDGVSPVCSYTADYCGVIITDLPPDSIQLEHHHLMAIEINGDNINIVTAYSGGCHDHYFQLYMSPAAFAESYPVQANLYLRHDGNYDPCDGWITDTLSFSLRPVGRLHNLMYDQPDSIIINVFEYFDSEPAGMLSALYWTGM
jgi:hypothetical protein